MRRFAPFFAVVLPNLTYSVFRFSSGVMVPDVEATFAINDATMGGILSASVALTALSGLTSSYVASRLKQVPSVIAGLLLFTIPLILTPFSNSLATFVPLFFLSSFGTGLTTVTAYSIAGSLVPGRKGTVISLVSMAYNVGGFVGPSITGFLLSRQAWYSPFLAMAAVGLVSAAMFALAFRGETRADAVLQRMPAANLMRNRGVVMASTIVFLCDLALLAYSSWAPKFLVSRFASDVGSAERLAYLFGISIGVGGLGTFVAGTLFDRIGGRRTALLSGTVTVGATLGMFALGSDSAVIGCMLVAGFVANWFWSIGTTMAQVSVSESDRTAVTSLVQTIGFVGAFIGPGLAGLAGGGTPSALLLTVTLPYSIYVVTLLVYRENAAHTQSGTRTGTGEGRRRRRRFARHASR